MKLLMTCDAVGGVWQYATDLARALADGGVEVVLAVLGPPSGEPRKRNRRACSPALTRCGTPASAAVTIIETNLTLDWLASGPAEVLSTGHTVAALAARHHADLIHLNSPTLAGAGPFPAPVVAVAHGCVGTWWAVAHGTAPDPAYTWHGELMRLGLLSANIAVAPSAAYAADLQRHYGLAEAPVAIHNGRAFRPPRPAASADHVFTAGRLWDRVKNVDLLDDVAALLPVPFRAAGQSTGPHGETVAPRHLKALGFLPDEGIAAELARQPIFVSAARYEPFGLAVLEAAQAGCPLVLSGIDTFRELWTGAALIVSDETPEAYAAAIARVRTEPGLRAHLSEAARNRAARYTPQTTASAMLDLYRSLLDEERAAA